MAFEMCSDDLYVPFAEATNDTPWLPIDYVVGVLLNQGRAASSNADASDVATWKNLIAMQRLDEACEVGLHRLSVRGVVRTDMSPFSSLDSKTLLLSSSIPVHGSDIGGLINYINA